MGWCMTPFTVKDKKTNCSIPVPCGRCPDCLKRRVSGWSFRLMQEDKYSLCSHFITLTYDTKHVPITKSGYMDLAKRDLQLFFKRLRKVNQSKLKYYAVGEYGGRSMRPHYHIILFNAEISTIQPSWGLGHVHYGFVTGASVGYTLKYIMKPSRIPLHRNDDRLREFSLMSKGLGAGYMTPAMINWHKSDFYDRMYCAIEGGKKIAMPRYFKLKMYSELERQRLAFFNKNRIEQQLTKEIADGGDNYWHEKFVDIKAAFDKMHYRASLGRNIV